MKTDKNNSAAHEPLLPFVTAEQMLDFDPAEPSTHTSSHIINAVCRAIYELGPVRLIDLAKYLEVSGAALSGAIEIATGMSYTQLRKHLQMLIFKRIKASRYMLDNQTLARRLGYKDSVSVKRFIDICHRTIEKDGEGLQPAFKQKKRKHLDWSVVNNHRDHHF